MLPTFAICRKLTTRPFCCQGLVNLNTEMSACVTSLLSRTMKRTVSYKVNLSTNLRFSSKLTSSSPSKSRIEIRAQSPNILHNGKSCVNCVQYLSKEFSHTPSLSSFSARTKSVLSISSINSPPLRCFYSKSGASTDRLDDDMSLKELRERARQEENAGWLIRLANENGYLSWCRNTYIGTVISATIYMQGHMVPYAKEAAFLFLIISGINMACGTMSYIYTVTKLRRKMMLAYPLWILKFCLATIHFLLWLTASAVYMGFVEEDPPEDLLPKGADI